MVFVLCLQWKKTIQRNKQIKQSLNWLKNLLKQLKSTFHLIKLNFSEAFREK